MSKNVFQHLYLTIPLPDQWEDTTTQLVALGPETDGHRLNLVLTYESTGLCETATEFADRQLPHLRSALNGYTLIKEGEARFGPNSGFLREYTFWEKTEEIGQLQFYVILGGRCYTFTFTDFKRNISFSRAIAERMFSQARLNPPLALPAGDDDF